MCGGVNRLAEKSPFRSPNVGTLLTRVMPSVSRVPS